ncbi:MAG TPA: energy-coupling factor transporter transmembrane component T [Thermomicrobiales bacterium]|nr:energy-coupling factor transporter transmembrane component T [Thermomicrobiales bacterium]
MPSGRSRPDRRISGAQGSRSQVRAVTPISERPSTYRDPVDATQVLDPRVWLVWLAAVTFPALAGRNPFPLFGLLIVVIVVRGAWAPALVREAGWVLVLRIALFAAVLSVLFNLLAAPFGDQVLVRLPSWWPLGDVMTLNALTYGLMGALAIVVIVLAGTIAGALVDWPELLRMVPGRLLPLAVAGSIAWAFVPRTVSTIRDIRDAQRSRGLRFESARAVLPLLVPLIATSLERASTTAEALESRGFGGSSGLSRSRRRRGARAMLAGGAALGVLAATTWLNGDRTVAGPTAPGAIVLLVWGLLLSRQSSGRTRYRQRRWTGADRVILAAAAASLGLSVLVWLRHREAVAWSPYPDVVWPAGDGWLMVAILLLFAPAVAAPLVVQRGESASRDALVQSPEAPGTFTVAVVKDNAPGLMSPASRRGHHSRQRPFACWPPRVINRGRQDHEVPRLLDVVPRSDLRLAGDD